jgi:colicin import membrane protein
MATAAKLKPVPADEPGTDMIAIVMQTPVVVLTDAKQRSSLYAHIEREIEAFVPDVTTNKGREAIKSLAFKVTKTKTAIDAAGKLLNEEARSKINLVDEARRDARNTLDILAERARKPLTDWEEAEAARVKDCRDQIDGIHIAAIIAPEDTADAVRARGTMIWSIRLDPDHFLDMLPEAQAAKDSAVATLKAALVRLEREEADRAELEKLRAAEAERVRIEEEKAAAEIERQAAEAKRIAEEQRLAAEKADAERIAAAEKAAEERAREAADQAAQAERDRVKREHEAVLAAEREKSAKMERGRQMLAYIREVVGGRIGPDVQPFGILLRELESKIDVNEADYGDMCAEIEQARIDGLANLNEQMERQAARRKAEEDRKAEHERQEEERKRQENRAHRSKIMGEVKADLMTFGVDEETARKIVTGIVAKTVRHTAVAF